MVLVAGLGKRLRPLTEFLPKPLLPVQGEPVAGHALDRLARAGCEAAALNLHHLGEQIRQAFGEERSGLPLTYSDEPEIRGTLGALAPLSSFLAPADLVLLVNGDTLCRWPFERLVRRHLAGGAEATVLLTRRADPATFGGGVEIDRDGQVLGFRGGPSAAGDPDGIARRVFAGAHVFAPGLLSRGLPAGRDMVSDLYEPLLRAGGRIRGVETSRPWHDLGTPRRYLVAALDWVSRSWSRLGLATAWRHPASRVARGARLRRSVAEAGAAVEPQARVEGSLLLAGARVGRGCRVTTSILGPGVELPPGTSVEGRLVTRQRQGVPARAGDSIVGGLVFTPL